MNVPCSKNISLALEYGFLMTVCANRGMHFRPVEHVGDICLVGRELLVKLHYYVEAAVPGSSEGRGALVVRSALPCVVDIG